MTTALTVQLDDAQIARLHREASRRGISAGDLAAEIVAKHLAEAELTAEEKKRKVIEALAKLDDLRANLHRRGVHPVDAVELVRQGREELEQRTTEWLSSQTRTS